MQAKDLTRGTRRDRRQRAIEHAFDIYWNKWGLFDDDYKSHPWRGYDVVYLETEEARRNIESEARLKCLARAKRLADHLRTCSCWICSGYKKHEKTPRQVRDTYKDADDLRELISTDDAFSFCPTYV